MHARFLDVFHDAADQDIAFGISDQIDIDLGGVIEEAIEQYRRFVGDLDRIAHVARKILVIMNDLHRASAEHIARTHNERIADFAGKRQGLFRIARGPIRRLHQTELLDHFLEAFTILGQID